MLLRHLQSTTALTRPIRSSFVSGKVMAMFYMLGTMAFISRALSALYIYQTRQAEQTKRAMRSAASIQSEQAAFFLYDWIGSYLPLLLAWFYIDFVSLLFGSTEGWTNNPHHKDEWGCGNCRLFGFMTMTTVGWGIGDMYDPIPPLNHVNLTVRNHSVICLQKSTRGHCIWAPDSKTCVCSLSEGGRFLLLPYSILGFAITGFALSTAFDIQFWRHRMCCCLEKAHFEQHIFNTLRRPFSAMQRTSNLLANGGRRSEVNNEEEEDPSRLQIQQRSSGLNKCCVGIKTYGGPRHRSLLLPFVPFTFLVVVLPLCSMHWISHFIECVGDETNVGDLGLGFLSAAFVIIQTASTVGYGDACMSRVISELDPWMTILLSCLLLSVFGSYLALMRYLIIAVANRTYGCCATKCSCTTATARKMKTSVLKQTAATETSSKTIELIVQKNNTNYEANTETCDSYEKDDESGQSSQSKNNDRKTPLWFLVVLVLSFNVCFFGIFLWPAVTGYQCFPEITSFVDFLYFLITTTTTVGFGDITPSPTCIQGRILSITAMVTGSVSLIVLLTEILVAVDVYSKKVRQTIADERHRHQGLDKVKSLLISRSGLFDVKFLSEDEGGIDGGNEEEEEGEDGIRNVETEIEEEAKERKEKDIQRYIKDGGE